MKNSTPDPAPELVDDSGNLITNPWYGTGEVRFSELRFSSPGEHVFRIRELAGTDEHYSYDETVFTIEVTIADNGDGTLSAELKYYDAAGNEVGENDLAFTNTVVPGKLSVTKTVRNTSAMSAEIRFPFTLKVTDVNGEPFVYETVPSGLSAVAGEPGSYSFKLKGGESFTVEGLPYGSVYSLEETETAGFVQTGSVNETGEIGFDDVTASFTNTYSASGSVEVPLRKTLMGGEIAEGEYVVQISGDGMQPITVSAPAAARDGESAQSDFTVTLNYNDVSAHGKTFRYTITELAGDQAVAYDPREIHGKVQVTDQGDGTLRAEWSFDEDGLEKANFVNYRLYELTIKKEVGGNMGDLELPFSFVASFGNLPEGFAVEVPGNWQKDESGVYGFTLSHGESYTVTLPYGATYSIREDAGDYRATRVIKRENPSLDQLLEEVVGTLVASDHVTDQVLQGNETVVFTNTLTSPIPTGVAAATGGGFLAAVSLLALGLSSMSWRKKKQYRTKHSK